MGRSCSNAELAAHLILSEATVKTHVARIFAKLNLRDSARAVVLAYETGLVSPGDTTGANSPGALAVLVIAGIGWAMPVFGVTLVAFIVLDAVISAVKRRRPEAG